MDRRERVLDAAITVLGTKGLRALTHRTVDAGADLPQGSTSNVFRTRDALLAGVLDRLLALEKAAWSDLASPDAPLSTTDFVARLAAMVRHLTDGAGRTLTLARHALMLEAAFSSPLREMIAAGHRDLETWALPWVAGLGSAHPRRDLWTLLATLDGLMTNRLAAPGGFFDPEAAIAAVLRGTLQSGPADELSVTDPRQPLAHGPSPAQA